MAARTFPPEVAEAKDYLRGRSLPLADVVALARSLLEKDQVSYARRVLARAADSPQGEPELVLELQQQLALATSNDPDLPWTRHVDALRILTRRAELATTRDQETLGIAAGILKRWWDLDGNVRHLERSLALYRRGYEEGIAKDAGYTAINTAFLLDLLAALDAEDAAAAGAVSVADDPRRAEAERIRREIIDVLPAVPNEPGKAWLRDTWWFHATLAEAHFGLDDYDRAKASLEDASRCEVKPWQFESTIRQLATLAQLRAGALGQLDREAFEASAPAQFVADFLGPAAAEGALSARLGRIGLALSGGGFRASIFHIGVLARLAELDVLRHVEVLSCVSGGSIVGAHYYLQVRNLLQSSPTPRSRATTTSGSSGSSRPSSSPESRGTSACGSWRTRSPTSARPSCAATTRRARRRALRERDLRPRRGRPGVATALAERSDGPAQRRRRGLLRRSWTTGAGGRRSRS